MTQAEERFYPNKIGRLYLLSLEDVMGEHGVSALLNMAGFPEYVRNYPPNDLRKEFPFTHLSKISQALEAMYGARGARGMELRAGRHAFELGLLEFGPLVGAADLAMKLMPLAMKAKIALSLTARTFDQFSDQVTRVEEEGDKFLYIIEKCPVCWGDRTSEEPVCHVARGILEQALHWVSGGKTFRVEEVECVAAGGQACVFEIDKKPLD